MSSPEFDYFAQDESRYLERGKDVIIRGEPVDISRSKSYKTRNLNNVGYTINKQGREEPETKTKA